MAFRKRKKITKGLSLNFSGSGIGIGAKVLPGLSFSMNSTGIFCNTSIPGSGFYSRNKISSFDKEDNNSDNNASSGNISNVRNDNGRIVVLKVSAENDGTYTCSYTFEDNGEVVTNPNIINNIKRQYHYKETVVRTINECTSELVDIYRLTAKPFSVEEMRQKVESKKPQGVRRNLYCIEQPTEESIKQQLELEAQQEISTLFFWNKKKKRDAYVAERLERKYKEAIEAWNADKEKYDLQQSQYVESEMARRQEEYNTACKAFEGFLTGGEDYVNDTIDQLLACVNVPFQFAINYEYHKELNLLRIELDLPEIEDFPSKKATILATEEISIKDKSKTEYRQDYATSVTGMSFFVAGMLFNISSMIKYIEVSAYTQRVEKTSGNEGDCYVYSVIFSRDRFAETNFDGIDPVVALQSYPNKSKILKSFEMREIIPFTIEETIVQIKDLSSLNI